LQYNTQTLHDPVFQADDSRAWRNECYNPGSTARIGDILGKWKEKYTQLEFIGRMNAIGNGPVHDGCGEEYEMRMEFWSLICIVDWLTDISQELKALMLKFGWPDEFDREGCRNAMLEWEQKRLDRNEE
jgi:hypothetical protein